MKKRERSSPQMLFSKNGSITTIERYSKLRSMLPASILSQSERRQCRSRQETNMEQITKKTTATRNEKRDLLFTRVARLQYFVTTFDGRPCHLIEQNAYLILETHNSRPRAIYRYIRY